MNYESFKIYEVTHREKKDKVVIGGESAQEVCKKLGWLIGDCHVRVVLDPADCGPSRPISMN